MTWRFFKNLFKVLYKTFPLSVLSVSKTGWLLIIDLQGQQLDSNWTKCVFSCGVEWGEKDELILSNNTTNSYNWNFTFDLWDWGFIKSVKLINLNFGTLIYLFFLQSMKTFFTLSFYSTVCYCTFVLAQQIGNYRLN